MNTTLISVPVKATEEVNWTKPINNYLLSVYGNTREFQDDLVKFNKLRQDLSGLGGDEKAVKAHFLYYSQLEILDLRIPMLKLNRSKGLSFTWTDAFLPDCDHRQSALPFEKASVLFNLGATLTTASALKYAASKRSDDDTDFKLSLLLMQQAAGVFQFLGDNFLHGPSSDMKPSTTRFLVQLCLAQSQEIFNLKVIDGDLEQKKNSLIAKLCSSTAKHYQQCYDATKHLLTAEGASEISRDSTFAITDTSIEDDILGLDSGEDTLDEPRKDLFESTSVHSDLDHAWISIFQFKYLYYSSACFYFQGLHLENSGKYGEAIAYLQKSSEFINEIPTTLLKTISKSRMENVYDLLDNYKFQKDALEIKLRDLSKDNDLIYHDMVPSTVTLAEPKPMDSAKATPMSQNEAFSQINEYHYNNFLKNVVPLNIHELLSYYSEEKSQLLRNELDAVDVSNEELASAMDYLNLPKALVSIKELYQDQSSLHSKSKPEVFSDSQLIQKVTEISQASAQVQRNASLIEQQRQEILQNVKGCEQAINSAPSNASYERFKDDLIKLKKSLVDAANSDFKLFALINPDNSGLYQTLCKGPRSQEFADMFQISGTQQPQPSEPEISLLDIDDFSTQQLMGSVESRIKQLEDLIYDINTHKAKKQKVVDKLKAEIHADDISDILLLNSKVKSTNEIKTIIFPDELKKFDVYLKALDEVIEKQKLCMKEVHTAWDQLVSDPEVKKIRESSSFKQSLIEEQKNRINDLYETWKKYSVGLQKGSEFYQRLLTFSKNLRNELMKEIQNGAFNNSVRSSDISSSMGSLRIDNAHGSARSQLDGLDSYHNMAQRNSHAVLHPTDKGSGQQHFGDAAYGNSGAAPELPPKRPSQSNLPSQRQGSANQEASWTQTQPVYERRGNEAGDDLIYNHPSAYQPNIYDMFLKR